VCLDGMVFIQDLGSTNKTYVGSMHARAPMQLTPGMKIRIANNVAVYFSH
ncbi:MAG: FHA domain-containing protein, partial [Planctomycetes bacterium]|nr:FHA domain-containing protein [Planctomycetota bacterium]